MTAGCVRADVISLNGVETSFKSDAAVAVLKASNRARNDVSAGCGRVADHIV